LPEALKPVGQDPSLTIATLLDDLHELPLCLKPLGQDPSLATSWLLSCAAAGVTKAGAVPRARIALNAVMVRRIVMFLFKEKQRRENMHGGAFFPAA